MARLLSTEDVATMAGVHRTTVSAAVSAGALPATTGRSVRNRPAFFITKADAVTWMNALTTNPRHQSAKKSAAGRKAKRAKDATNCRWDCLLPFFKTPKGKEPFLHVGAADIAKFTSAQCRAFAEAMGTTLTSHQLKAMRATLTEALAALEGKVVAKPKKGPGDTKQPDPVLDMLSRLPAWQPQGLDLSAVAAMLRGAANGLDEYQQSAKPRKLPAGLTQAQVRAYKAAETRKANRTGSVKRAARPHTSQPFFADAEKAATRKVLLLDTWKKHTGRDRLKKGEHVWSMAARLTGSEHEEPRALIDAGFCTAEQYHSVEHKEEEHGLQVLANERYYGGELDVRHGRYHAVIGGMAPNELGPGVYFMDTMTTPSPKEKTRMELVLASLSRVPGPVLFVANFLGLHRNQDQGDLLAAIATDAELGKALKANGWVMHEGPVEMSGKKQTRMAAFVFFKAE